MLCLTLPLSSYPIHHECGLPSLPTDPVATFRHATFKEQKPYRFSRHFQPATEGPALLLIGRTASALPFCALGYSGKPAETCSSNESGLDRKDMPAKQTGTHALLKRTRLPDDDTKATHTHGDPHLPELTRIQALHFLPSLGSRDDCILLPIADFANCKWHAKLTFNSHT